MRLELCRRQLHFVLIGIVSKIEQLTPAEVNLAVYEFFALSEHHKDKDKCVTDQNETIYVEPVRHVLRFIAVRERKYVHRKGGQVDENDLHHC